MTTITPNTTSTDISYNLAKAIGWKDKDIRTIFKGIQVRTPFSTEKKHYIWKTFDYTDPTVIYNIAKEYDCFPSAIVEGNYLKAKKNNKPTILEWEVLIWNYSTSKWNRNTAKTPELAIALAVIHRANTSK